MGIWESTLSQTKELSLNTNVYRKIDDKTQSKQKQGTRSTSEAGWALDPPQPMAGFEALAPKSRNSTVQPDNLHFLPHRGLQHRSVFVVTRIILHCLSSVQSSFGKDRSFEFEITKFRAFTLTSHWVHQILTSTTHKCLLWRKTPLQLKSDTYHMHLIWKPGKNPTSNFDWSQFWINQSDYCQT